MSNKSLNLRHGQSLGEGMGGELMSEGTEVEGFEMTFK